MSDLWSFAPLAVGRSRRGRGVSVPWSVPRLRGRGGKGEGSGGPSRGSALEPEPAESRHRPPTEVGYASRCSLAHRGLASEARSTADAVPLTRCAIIDSIVVWRNYSYAIWSRKLFRR